MKNMRENKQMFTSLVRGFDFWWYHNIIHKRITAVYVYAVIEIFLKRLKRIFFFAQFILNFFNDYYIRSLHNNNYCLNKIPMYLQFGDVHGYVIGYFSEAQISTRHFRRYMTIASTLRRWLARLHIVYVRWCKRRQYH